MTEKINLTDYQDRPEGLRGDSFNERQIRGFEQQLTTPPAPGEPTTKYRDYDGVFGTEVTWSEEKKRWTFTGIELNRVPPKDGEPTTKISQAGLEYTWVPEKGRWWCFDFTKQEDK